MPLLGPRVGGAHVDVNLDFDEGDLDRIGRRIHRSLQRLGGEADETFGRQFRENLGQMQVAIGGIVTALPLVSSAVSALSGSIVALSAAIVNASKASLGWIGVLGATAIALGTAIIGFEGFGDAITADDPEKLAEALANLSPAARSAALAVRSLKDDWKRLRLNVQEQMFAGLSDSIRELGDTILPVLSEGLGKMADSLNVLFGSLLDYVNSDDALELINDILERSAEIFKTLAETAVPFLDGVLRVWNALLPSGARLADKISDIAERFQEWASDPGMAERIDDMMRSAEESASKLWTVLRNLGGALRNIFSAAQPAGDSFLEWLIEITEKFREWTSSAEGRNSIAEWAEAGVETIKKLGETLGSAGTFFAKISDPSVIQGVLDILKQMFDTLNSLPLEDIVSSLGDFLSSNSRLLGSILAVGAAMSSLRFIGGTVRALFGSLATTVLNFAGIFTFFKGLLGEGGLLGPIAARGAHGVAVGRFANIFKTLSGFLKSFPKLLKGAGLAGLAVWIATTIAGSDKLRKKLGDVFKKVGEVFGKVVDAIGQIAESLEPVFEAILFAIDVLTPVLEFLIGLSFDVLIEQLDALGTVIEGVADLISGFIDVVVGLLTLDFDKVGEGLGKIFSGVGSLVSGAIQSLAAFPAILGEIFLNAIKAGGEAIVRAAPGVLSSVGNFISQVVSFIQQLPGRFLELAALAMQNLVTAIVNAIPGILNTVSGFVGEVIGFIASLPGRFLSFAAEAMGNLLSEISSGAGDVIGEVSKIPGQIMGALSGLPGQLLELGRNMIGSLASGISSAALNVLPGPLGGVARTIAGFLPGSPVKEGPLRAWNYGGGASGGGRGIVAALAEGLKDISPISSAMHDMAGAVANPLSVMTRDISLTIHNPVPETGSESLTRTARNLSYLGLL